MPYSFGGPMVDDVKFQWKIELDHPVRPASRWGYGRPPHPHLAEIIAAGRARYRSTLEDCFAWSQAFDAMPAKYVNETVAYWACGWMAPLELMVLYALIAGHGPARCVEIGSGCSAAVARIAIQENKC